MSQQANSGKYWQTTTIPANVMFLFLIIIDMVNYDVDMNIVTPDDIASKVCRLKGDYLDFCIAIAELQALLDE